MTFKEISFKMLRNNYKRYLLYFCCNTFTIALFYAFAAMYTNDKFMNGTYMDKSISSNIYAPSALTAIFMVLFIPYSYGAFLKNRKSEYGILMTLGMCENEVVCNMLLENIVVSIFSLIGGLVIGTGLSFVFFMAIRHLIGIQEILWELNTKSYWITIKLYLVVVALTLFVQVIQFFKMQIVDMFKARFREERTHEGSKYLFILGIAVTIISIIVMAAGYGCGKTYMWFASLFTMMLGSMLIIGSMNRMRMGNKTKFQAQVNKVCIEKSFIMQHFKSYKIVTFIVIWLFGIMIFFEGFSAVMYPDLLDGAIHHSPYDLLYIQVDKNNNMPASEVQQLLRKYSVTVTKEKEIQYIRDGAVNLLPVSQVNKTMGCNYNVKNGKYFEVYQYDLNEGNLYEMKQAGIRTFDTSSKPLKLQYAGEDVRILFNHNNGFADVTLVLNDEDYATIEKQGDDFISGKIKMFQFQDWKDSKEGLDALQKVMVKKNNLDSSEQKYYTISSKLEAYKTAKQSAEFLLLVMSFVIILFYVSANVIIYFKMQSEFEDEKRMYQGLFRIGIAEKEMQKIIFNKNVCYYGIPLLVGITIGIFYNYTVNSVYGYGWISVKYGMAISAVLILLQCIVIKFTSRYENNMLGV